MKLTPNMVDNMTAEQLKKAAKFLEERLQKAEFDRRVYAAVLQDFLDKQKENDERLADMKAVLSELGDLKKKLRKLTANCKLQKKMQL